MFLTMGEVSLSGPHPPTAKEAHEMGDDFLKDMFDNMPDPDDKRGKDSAVDFVTSVAPRRTAQPKQDIGPSWIAFVDRLKPGMVFVSPHPCDGRDCGLAATSHVAGRYHEGAVLDVRNESIATVVIYADEDGVQQSLGPMPGIIPIRVKLTVEEIGDLPG